MLHVSLFTTFVSVTPGGGKIEIEVAGGLEVSGYIQANSLDVEDLTAGQYQYSGGGTGGSIMIHTGNFTGGETGKIEVKGGAGDLTYGGGGAGGRIAVYHTHDIDAAAGYRGEYNTEGGAGAEPGASGTFSCDDVI